MRLLHLSDTHLFGDDGRHYGIVDTTAALRQVLDHAASIERIDAVVCSGDLSDDGSPASYRKLRDLVEPWAGTRGAAVAYAMGNHDVADGFAEVLGPVTGMTSLAGMRIARLSSAVPGRGYGHLDRSQLDWLRAELSTSRQPTVVLLHHPPIPAISPLLAGLELDNPADLLDVCAGASVVAILAGHYHHSLVTAERGIPVIAAPGIANTTDAHAPAGHERATVGSAYAVIDIPLGDESSADGRGSAVRWPRVTIHAVPSAEDGREIFDLGPDQVAEIIASAGAPRADAR